MPYSDGSYQISNIESLLNPYLDAQKKRAEAYESSSKGNLNDLMSKYQDIVNQYAPQMETAKLNTEINHAQDYLASILERKALANLHNTQASVVVPEANSRIYSNQQRGDLYKKEGNTQDELAKKYITDAKINNIKISDPLLYLMKNSPLQNIIAMQDASNKGLLPNGYTLPENYSTNALDALADQQITKNIPALGKNNILNTEKGKRIAEMPEMEDLIKARSIYKGLKIPFTGTPAGLYLDAQFGSPETKKDVTDYVASLLLTSAQTAAVAQQEGISLNQGSMRDISNYLGIHETPADMDRLIRLIPKDILQKAQDKANDMYRKMAQINIDVKGTPVSKIIRENKKAIAKQTYLQNNPAIATNAFLDDLGE